MNPMELLDPLAQAFDHTTKVLSGVDAEDLDNPTPCTEWDVRTLVGHVLGVVTNMGRGARGEAIPSDPAVTSLEADLAAQFRTVADATLAAWATRAADDTVNVGAGPMPVAAALSVNLIDTTTHSWDIARGTGQDAQIPDQVAATVLAVAQGFVTDEIRGFAGFGSPVAAGEGASPTDLLVAFLGRRP